MLFPVMLLSPCITTPFMAKAKPFIKWVGGKGQLISQLEAMLPKDFAFWKDVCYIEPFVGGGAMLFHMLQAYPNITAAVINDINPDLITCYKVVRDEPLVLLEALDDIQRKYYALPDEDSRRGFFMEQRACFNTKKLNDIENTTLFFFLNRTCFNGLYRVNKSGLFNVPFGKYTTPTICDRETILADSELLKRVDILNGDFESTLDKARGTAFFYLDPPYRPLSNTSSFNDYAKEAFNDDAQVRLKQFCDRLQQAGHYFMLSNSDCIAKNPADSFFDDLYASYQIDRVWASRNVNADAAKRGKLTEILVRNFNTSVTTPSSLFSV